MKSRFRTSTILSTVGLLSLVALGLLLTYANRTQAKSDAPPNLSAKFSSGMFALPANANSVDWVVVNNSPSQQTVRVTVYKGIPGQAKVQIPPGPVTTVLKPGFVFHNANSVGPNGPFIPGFYYEVVVESEFLQLNPSVQVWQNAGGTAIPGTLISPGDFSK